MTKIVQQLIRFKSIIMYGIFGVLTTIINIAVYYIFYNLLGISNVVSTVFAWVFAVAFAFITNKLWVFNSKSFDRDILKHEIPPFFGARLLTGVLDVAIMYFAVDLLHGNAMIWKLVSNAIVIILNYIASKLLIFRKK